MERIHWKQIAKNLIAALAFERIDRLGMSRSDAYDSVAEAADLDEGDIAELGFKTTEQEEREDAE